MSRDLRLCCAILLGGALLALACSAPPAQTPPPPRPTAKPSAQPRPTAKARAKARPPGPVGGSCTGKPFTQGDCAAGLLCGSLPGGYCTSLRGMGGTCPAPGRWVESARAGELCAPPCQSDADCRRAQRYTCHPTWRVCTMPGMLAPKPPACHAPALVKKTFGAATQLTHASSPGLYTFEVAGALLRDGSVAIVYSALRQIGEGDVLGAVLVPPKGEPVLNLTVPDGRQDHFDPWMAVDRSGKLHLVWLGFNGHRVPEKDMQVGYATSIDGKTWSKPVAVHDQADCPDGVGCLDKPMIAIGPRRRSPRSEAIYVAYQTEHGGGTHLVRSFDGGATFSRAVHVLDGSYGTLVVDDRGNVHTVAIGDTPGIPKNQVPPDARFGAASNRVEYAVSLDDGATFTTRVVSRPGELIPYYLTDSQIVVDSARKLLYVVYPAGTPDGKWNIVLASSRDQGKTWRHRQVNDDAPCAAHHTPTAALDPRTGELHVAWTENRSGAGGFAYSVCSSGGATCSANEAVNDAPFAAYSLGRFAKRTLGEYYPMLLDTKRRVLHAIWTQPVDEGDEAHSRIFHARTKL